MQVSLDTVFFALSDPVRRAILVRLAAGEATVGELADPFTISPPAVSRHLKVLERAGLIACERQAQWRRCRIRPESLRSAAAWIEQYRRFWEARFDALADYLEETDGKGGSDDGETGEG